MTAFISSDTVLSRNIQSYYDVYYIMLSNIWIMPNFFVSRFSHAYSEKHHFEPNAAPSEWISLYDQVALASSTCMVESYIEAWLVSVEHL